MKIARDNPFEGNAVKHYQRGRITLLDERVVTGSAILSQERLITDWRPERFEDLLLEDFELFNELNPQVALLGTGERLRFPARAIMDFFAVRGIGLEVMDTAAACRTFNVLAADGRSVAAALLML